MLIIRLSSIGDIVLCTPVIRVIGKSDQNQVHVVTKSAFTGILEGNPYIHAIHDYETELNRSWTGLRDEKFDLVIDLHKNLRSKRLIKALGVPSMSFDKINLRKWLAVNYKRSVLPNKHLVDRYFEGISGLNLLNDGLGLDFFPEDVPSDFSLPERYICLALGAAHATKVMPESLIKDLLSGLDVAVVLIGGPDDTSKGETLTQAFDHVVNAAGKLTIRQSASVIEGSLLLMTPDTGMMHIGAALKKPIISIWGNTVPEFGMYPYYGDFDIKHYMAQVDLNCRPCSKIGYDECPKGHFNCMHEQDTPGILKAAKKILNSMSAAE